ncbi:DUF3945 domain-containing protein [Hymenobacter sp. YC55]|uniref:DUF3945 domain-containing protein n=1 Tax=Hymenobacter sp. YC55 TaxID=3034019 RepID=UPI0023F88DA1|nr:DUF3945 domain-containing protein [Hymenobacter sp. YC55]MDF7813936.1 DUF3945 domain-containing protein [Hymenobacter sp. YC55]
MLDRPWSGPLPTTYLYPLMAAQNEVPTPVTLPPTPAVPQVIYLNGLPAPDGVVDSQLLSNRPTGYSILQLKIDPTNPDRAEGITAPGSDPQLINGYHATLRPLFKLNSTPQAGQEYIHTELPAQFERQGTHWKLTVPGQISFSNQPPLIQATTNGVEQAQQTILSRTHGEANQASPVSSPSLTAPAGPEKVVSNSGPPLEPKNATAAAQQPAIAEQPTNPGELQIRWQQQGEAVAPLLEMRAYFDQLKEAGVAVGALRFEKKPDGKLSGNFSLSYDPASAELPKLEGIIQGLKRVGNGLEVVEQPEQVVARRQNIGVQGQDQATDLGYSVKEAFGIKQWDALSAHLSQVPKQALTGPELMQQAAGEVRVEQLAQRQGKITEQVVKEGKSLLDIDTSGNPVSAFLKNFYEHLNGAPQTRQHLEVDYEKTRQALQARLLQVAGNADPNEHRQQAGRVELAAPRTTQTLATAAAATDVAAGQQGATQTAKFAVADLPQRVLTTMGLTVDRLAAQGQLQKLLNGDKTDLLTLQAGGGPDQELVPFQAKMVLHREANGSATLKMELPKRELTIPNEIGGQTFTAEQRQRLATEGTAGLVRGLKDAQGNPYNGYVGVDKQMNKVVVLPENKVQFKDTIAGVKLSPEQSHDLREGKAVPLAQMQQPNGGKPFDGIVRIHAAKAGVEVKPAAYELSPQPAAKITRPLGQSIAVKAPPKVRGRGPRE